MVCGLFLGGNCFLSYNNDFKNIVSLDENQEIINVVEEDKNILWLCTRNGLFQFKKS